MESLEQYFHAETGDIPLDFAWKEIYPNRKLLVVNEICNEMGDIGLGLLVKSIMHSLRFCVVEEIVDETTSLNTVVSLYNMLGRPLTVGLYNNYLKTYKDFSEILASYITAKEAKISCRIGEEPINVAFFNFPQSISKILLNFEVLSVTSLFRFFNSYKTLNLNRYSLTLSIPYGKNGEFFDRYVQWCQNLEEPRYWFRNVKIKHADAPYIKWEDFPENRDSLANQRHTFEDSRKPKWTYFANLQSGYQLIIHLYTTKDWKFFSEVRTITIRNHTCEFIIEEV
uniref:Uncharacterized protein n=1 Tax=Acrobeloides nanus TaxID=290746 RepID=A0A914EAL7_9BILA